MLLTFACAKLMLAICTCLSVAAAVGYMVHPDGAPLPTWWLMFWSHKPVAVSSVVKGCSAKSVGPSGRRLTETLPAATGNFAIFEQAWLSENI
jgi:hypothetical protein